MRPVSLPGLLLAIAVALPAQAQDLHTVPMPGSRKDDLALPLIVSEANPSAASRLNAFVQLVYLDGLLKPGEKDPFARVRYDSNHDGPGSTSSLSWSASSQGRLLSLQVVSETTGAYSTETTDDLLLDATHGQPVSAADLFTPEGMKALGTRLASLRKAKLRQEIQSEKRGKSDEETQACLAVQEESLKEQTFDGITGLCLDATTLAFPASLDLPHVVLACDVDLTLALPRQELAPYLSAYGKALLDSTLPAPALPTAWTSRVFTGRIGTAPVVIQLHREADGSLTGSYAYVKRGSALELSGSSKSGALDLDETNADGDSTGHLTLKDHGLSLTGIWSSLDGTRSLPLTASAE
ncbi:MAG: hypothetical protein JST24_02055 [Acidobacteria bacterium]|nr:hypothetical protein [Acidobacteriota bacterium]